MGANGLILRTLYIPILLSLLPPLNQLLSIDEDALLVLAMGANKELAHHDRFGSLRAPYRDF